MSEVDLIKRMCNLYGIDFDEAIILMGIKNNCCNSKTNVSCGTKKINNDVNVDIKPFDGIVKENCCKAVVYNHGLYTQCTNQTTREFCSSVCKRQKYGHINNRKNYPVGTYVLENGKREIAYQKVKKRLNKKNTEVINQERILTQDSDEDEETVNDVVIGKNPRGRPKMATKEIDINIDSSENNNYVSDDDENIEEVCVRRQFIDSKEYLVSEHNVVFDSKSYKMIGRLILGKIVKA